MGVLTNGFRDTVGVFRTYGGTVLNNCYPQGTRGNYARTGMMRNITAGEGITSDMVGVPMGYADRGWIMPQKGGMMSARLDGVSVSAQAAGLRGMLAEGSATVAITVPDATGGLIASGAGSASITFSVDPLLLTASIGGTGAATMAFSGSALLGAEANLTASATFALSGTMTPYAVGNMEGSTEGGGELTASSIAAAVWTRAVEAGYTAEQILRVLAAVAAGSATGLEGANPRFTGLDGATVRVDGTYSAGTRTITALEAA